MKPLINYTECLDSISVNQDGTMSISFSLQQEDEDKRLIFMTGNNGTTAIICHIKYTSWGGLAVNRFESEKILDTDSFNRIISWFETDKKGYHCEVCKEEMDRSDLIRLEIHELDTSVKRLFACNQCANDPQIKMS